MELPKYITTVGLEIHAELKTSTKMFCNSKNDPDEERPNVNVCPVCMGHPGTLPVINKQAVKHVICMGTALGGTIANFTEFDRKNYFYPDLPKGYQISQYKHPLVTGGSLNGVALTRIHLEEDTARSTHDTGKDSLIDFNRAGVPLMELVTEPVIHSAEQASAFAKELQLLLQYLGAGDANMEKGEMRVEANISVAPVNVDANASAKAKLGTKVEVKNLNSFRAVERAIAYEVERHIELLEKGEKVVQETRGWDETKEETFSQRLKEESHDYRYFPDPDLPKIYINEIPEFAPEKIQRELVELPWQRRDRLTKEFGLKAEDVEMYVRTKEWGDYFEAVVQNLGDKKLAATLSNYMNSDLAGLIKNNLQRWQTSKIAVDSFAALIIMTGKNEISSRGAKDILKIIFENGGDPKAIAEENGFMQQSGTETLLPTVKKIIENNAAVVADFKAGKQAAIQFLVGQAMKETRGAGNPGVLRELFIKELS